MLGIGNTKRGRRLVRLRVLSNGEWFYLSRDPLGWRGPFGNASAAYAFAMGEGHLWRKEELMK